MISLPSSLATYRAKYQPSAAPALRPMKELCPHQTNVRGKVGTGSKSAARGTLITACGTGKTFISLKIAVEAACKDIGVRILVPNAIVDIGRKEFGKGDDFCKKVTNRASGKSEDLIKAFRTEPEFRLAVTVDMIATGTDIKPLE
ncbi:MAG: hypothetical protein EON58_21395 [Alphaproteobacteria bacterium]|nr:MAG: hypothetical protein EON58_21395 [Alphaproteobacteria bacterium]